jgi:hypothetical protein
LTILVALVKSSLVACMRRWVVALRLAFGDDL